MDQFLNMEFTAYVGLAVLLYAVRSSVNFSNRFIPLVAIVLGVLFAWAELKAFDFKTLLSGIQYGLYGIGSVASIKYVKKDTDGITPDSVIRIDDK